MTLALLLIGLFTVLVLLVRHHIRMDAQSPRGTSPHPNDHLIEGGFGSGGPGSGNLHTWRVTRDPKKYAEGFVPVKVRKTDER